MGLNGEVEPIFCWSLRWAHRPLETRGRRFTPQRSLRQPTLARDEEAQTGGKKSVSTKYIKLENRQRIIASGKWCKIHLRVNSFSSKENALCSLVAEIFDQLLASTSTSLQTELSSPNRRWIKSRNPPDENRCYVQKQYTSPWNETGVLLDFRIFHLNKYLVSWALTLMDDVFTAHPVVQRRPDGIK